MQPYPPTVILRHARENLKKCSLRGLETRPDFDFYTYPKDILPDLSGYLLLSIDGSPLSAEDSGKGLLILDGTWRLAEKMNRFVDSKTREVLQRRSIPGGFRTAYPRRQNDCPDPTAGLASIEAIYIAYKILGRNTDGILDQYYWKDDFLKNFP